MNKNVKKQGVGNERELFRLARVALDYRRTLVRDVEAIVKDMGVALAGIEMRENPGLRVGNRQLSDEAFLVMVRRTFFGDLPQVLGKGYLRTFFSEPGECLRRVMEDVEILRAYLAPLMGDMLSPLPDLLTSE